MHAIPYPSTLKTTNLFALGGHQSSSVCRFASCFVVCFTQSSNVSIVSLHACTHCQILSQLFFFSNAPLSLIDYINSIQFTTCDPSACIAPIRRAHIACTLVVEITSYKIVSIGQAWLHELQLQNHFSYVNPNI
jgi:hypothetical protein